MSRDMQARLLRDETEALLAPISGNKELREIVRSALRSSLLLPSETGEHKLLWPLLPLMVCVAASGHYEQALPAAAAIELFKAAAEVLDDIEDADSSESLVAKYGLARATNAATALVILAEKGLGRLKRRGVPDATIVRILDEANSYYAQACLGQHLDVSLPPGCLVSEETYLEIAGLKSGSQTECSCSVGALIALADKAVLDAFRRFGRNIGIAAQIINDIRGIVTGKDILKRKITLPVTYALAQSDGDALAQLQTAFLLRTGSMPDVAHIRDILFDVGAMQYAAVQTELYKQFASDALDEAEMHGATTAGLKVFFGE